MLIGMVANTLYQGTIVGITNLVEERENDLTAELFVAPISRYAVLLGKIVGSGIASLVSLVGIVAMIVVMQIPMNVGDPAPGHRPGAGAGAGRWIARRVLHRLRAGSEDRGGRRRAAGLPADVPRRALIPTAASTGILGLLAS